MGRFGGPPRGGDGLFGHRQDVRQAHRTVGVPNERGHVEAVDQLAGRHTLAPFGDADRGGQGGAQRSGIDAPGDQLGQRDRTVALGQTLTVGADDQRHVGVPRRTGSPSASAMAIWLGVDGSRSSPRATRSMLRRRRRRRPPRGCRRERRRCDAGRRRTACRRTARPRRRRRPRLPPSARKRTAGRPLGSAFGALAVGEVAARPGIRQRGIAVRRRSCLADLAAGAEALVRESGSAQLVERLLVEGEALALAPDVTVPVDPEGDEVGALGALVFRRRRHPIEVLHAQPEDVACRTGQQPGDQRRAQVADVQRARRRRSESAGHRRQSAECLQAARQRPLGSIACSATSAEPRCALSTSSAWNVAPACDAPPGSSPSRRRLPTTRRRTDCRRSPRRRATRCSTRSPVSSWPSLPRRRCPRPTRTPPTSSLPSAHRWAAAGSGRQTCRRRVPAAGTTPPTPARCGRARPSTTPAEPAPTTTMQPPYRGEYDGGVLRRHRTSAGQLRPVGGGAVGAGARRPSRRAASGSSRCW